MIRYNKNNGALFIGTQKNKLCIFARERCGCIEIDGARILHFGNWR